ncbi:MAG: divalent-cation tolerance protein CutA [Polyangiaceae bacterium]|nr:divalent-cation tolerance protein CutA [Polyangiaceae bacterium]
MNQTDDQTDNHTDEQTDNHTDEQTDDQADDQTDDQADEPADLIVLMCSVPNDEVALKISNALVEEHLAACVSTVPGLRSIYRWEGKICNETELLLLIKSVETKAIELAVRVKELHPYETPELIALPVVGGIAPYVRWVREQTTCPKLPE